MCSVVPYIWFFTCADEEDQTDVEPEEKYMRVFKTKLRELARILSDVYSPAESYRINKKLNSMGRLSAFVSIFGLFTRCAHVLNLV